MLRASGLHVQEGLFRTRYGNRYIDLVVKDAERVVESFEVKLGGSRYSVLQMMTDEWLFQELRIPTRLFRIPR
jgi:hypothetical protein